MWASSSTMETESPVMQRVIINMPSDAASLASASSRAILSFASWRCLKRAYSRRLEPERFSDGAAARSNSRARSLSTAAAVAAEEIFGISRGVFITRHAMDGHELAAGRAVCEDEKLDRYLMK